MSDPDEELSTISYMAIGLGVPVVTHSGQQFGVVEHVLQVPELDVFDGIVVYTGTGVAAMHPKNERAAFAWLARIWASLAMSRILGSGARSRILRSSNKGLIFRGSQTVFFPPFARFSRIRGPFHGRESTLGSWGLANRRSRVRCL